MTLSALSDEALARRVQAGETAAFDLLVDRYGGRILGYLRRRLRDPHAAEDVTQATFVRAFRQLRRYDADRRFSAWLFTIAARLAASHLRRRPDDVGGHLPEPVDERDPSRLAMADEQAESLWRTARQVLTANQYHAVWLRYAEDLSVREVAAAMQLTAVHVKVLLFRARGRLARALDETAADAVRLGEVPGIEFREIE